MRSDDCTEARGARHPFPTTSWMLIDRITRHEADYQVLIGLLLQCYWKPVYYYLRRRGRSNEEAQDLTQGFLCEVVLNHHLVERADPAKGRFRSFLLHALNQYLINEKAKQSARMRIPRSRLVRLEAVDPNALPASILASHPDGFYHYAWVSALLDEVLAEVKQACCAKGLKTHWDIFNARVVQPIWNNRIPPTLDAICKKYGIADPGKASNMTITVKRRFRAVLREHICRTVGSDEYVDTEIDDLIRFLPKAAQDRLQ